MKQCMDSENLHRRLRKILGQVQAIDRMIEEDIPCEDVLSQINAAKSALHKVGQVVLEGHINHCVRDGIEHGDVDKTISDFTKSCRTFLLIWENKEEAKSPLLFLHKKDSTVVESFLFPSQISRD